MTICMPLITVAMALSAFATVRVNVRIHGSPR